MCRQWYIGLDRHPYDTDTRPIARKNGSSSDAATALSPASGSKVSQLDVKVMGESHPRAIRNGVTHAEQNPDVVSQNTTSAASTQRANIVRVWTGVWTTSAWKA